MSPGIAPGRSPVAVITGASSGIGAACARSLTAAGYQVVAAARRVDRLSTLADEIGCRTQVLDVTDTASVAALAATLERCDILINNAGAAFGADPVVDADPDDWRRAYEVNVLGTLRVTQALIPLLRASAAASIVMMCSTASFVNYETGGGYSAAKHAEHALTETLRLELCGEPIRVIEIAPGMVATEEFSVHRFGGDADRAAGVYADVDHPMVAADVAACVLAALALPQHVNVDRMIVRPLAQAAQHKTFRGPLFNRG